VAKYSSYFLFNWSWKRTSCYSYNKVLFAWVFETPVLLFKLFFLLRLRLTTMTPTSRNQSSFDAGTSIFIMQSSTWSYHLYLTILQYSLSKLAGELPAFLWNKPFFYQFFIVIPLEFLQNKPVLLVSCPPYILLHV